MNGEVYLWPSAAEKKLRTAYQTELPAYLYGVTGVGKTSLIEHFLDKKPYQYFSALNTTPEDLDTGKISAPTVVLDDLYTIADIRLKDAYFQKIQELMERKDLWVVLISRAPFPAWLLSLRMKYSFVIIQEEDFCLTREQQDEYLERYGLQASDEQLARAWAVGRGNPMSLRVYVMENGDLEATMRTVWTYLESHVYDQWDTELQDFFMDVSIVKEFTVDLAAMITGNKHVEHMLAQGMETGNFFEKMGEKDGIWRCKDPMRWSMEQRLHKNAPRNRSAACIITPVCTMNWRVIFRKPWKCIKYMMIQKASPAFWWQMPEKMQPAAITTNCGNTIWSFRRRSSGKIRF